MPRPPGLLGEGARLEVSVLEALSHSRYTWLIDDPARKASVCLSVHHPVASSQVVEVTEAWVPVPGPRPAASLEVAGDRLVVAPSAASVSGTAHTTWSVADLLCEEQADGVEEPAQPAPVIVGLHCTGDPHTGIVIARADGRIAVVQLDANALTVQARLWGRVVGVPVGLDGRAVAPASPSSRHSVAYFDSDGREVFWPHREALTGREALTAATAPPPASTSPKKGRVDPSNAPHVGGNTWAGGSGGSDTAGLGGRGGPYRLDSGHPVTQVGC